MTAAFTSNTAPVWRTTWLTRPPVRRGNMPCNPAIGGTGKGHLVRELDALGGEMARAADAACIQYRLLNRGKGPAVHSLRAQADRRKYQEIMKHALERQGKLTLRQGEVTEIRPMTPLCMGERSRFSRMIRWVSSLV